jgi:trehalose 6-phosphate synthase
MVAATGSASVLVASNRGPVSFTTEDGGEPSMHRGGGGLVSGLSSVANSSDVVWVCAALSDTDRAVAAEAPRGRIDQLPAHGEALEGMAVRMLDIPSGTFHRAYNSVANSTLWFVHHMLYDTPRRPNFGDRFARDWQSYVEYNAAFATAVAEEAAPNARVVIQDYHLTLAPGILRDLRPDLAIGHFSHTPWAPPDYFQMLPDSVAGEVLLGVLGADHAGFLSPRWASAFLDCCERVLDAKVDRTTSTVSCGGRVTRIGVHALGVDADDLRQRAALPDVESRIETLRGIVGDRQLIVRIDRTELSKNIVRGLAAYRELLRSHPEWHGRIVHVAFAYPSRHDLPEYREYTASVQRIAREIEDEFATPDWRPLVVNVNDDYARSLAAYRLADVLVVNPIRDGMNLVAKEGPILSDNGCALVLSREAGAADELAANSFVINPFDIAGTARAMHAALSMPVDERRARCEGLAAAASALPPQKWFAEQLSSLA